MKACPTKFLDLKLPTYNVDVNVCLEDDHVKITIERLILKNQCGELSFCFTPKSINNNVYSGELTVKNKADHSITPLKKFLKHFHKKKYFPGNFIHTPTLIMLIKTIFMLFLDISKDEKCTYSTFNPIKLKNLVIISKSLNQ